MTRKLLVGAIAAGALVVTAGTAFALSSDDGTTTPAAQVTTSTSDDSTFTSPTSSSDVTPTSDPTSVPTDTSTPVQPGSLTAADASRIATDRFGGTVREVELEFEHGRVEWKVEITAADGLTYDVRVDSSTGAITRVDQDARGGDDDDRGVDDHGGHDRGGDDHGGGRHGGDDH
jgi:uncharacterized membrane protein YkoI